jgi:hypothetical protein
MKTRNMRMIRGSSGTIIQSLDVLDYSVIHLSAYERSLRKYHRLIKTIKHPQSIEVMEEVTKIMIENVQNQSSTTTSTSTQERSLEMKRTLVVMPFLGTGMGSGHSVLANRYVYLKTCFWSFYADYPHIVVGVTSEADYNYCK